MVEILIVDDEPMVIHGLCKQIDWESYTLELAGTAETGESALEILKHKKVDILFTDICMSKMDGLSLVSAAKQQNPSLRCVVISAHSEFNYVKKALLLGVENYLLKPIDQNELNQTLEKIIDNLKRDSIGPNKDLPDLSAFRVNILDRWVHNDIQDYEFYERAAMLDINLSAQQYQICVMEPVGTDNPKQRTLQSEMLLEKCRTDISGSFTTECFIDRANRVTILASGNGLESGKEEYQCFLDRIVRYATDNGILLFASASPVSEGVENIARQYADAVEYLNYRFINPKKSYVFYEDITRAFEKLECAPVLVQMEKAIMEEDFEKANAILRGLLDSYRDTPLESVKASLIPFLTMLIRRIIESGNASETLPNIDIMGFDRLDSIDTLEDCSQWIASMMNQSFEVMNKRKTSLHLLVQRTLDIIKKNYHNDMSLKTISADFKLSPAYLGQLFRDATGKYFNHYLTEVRLNASRALLIETDLKIMEILYRIGISNQSYFNRIFKKTYGISPLEYRYQGKHHKNREE